MSTEAADPSDDAAASSLRVSLLGPFVAVCEGRTLVLPKKAQALLAYLLLNRARSVPREELATLLWGSSGTDQARQSLRQSLSVLWRTLAQRPAQGEMLSLANTSRIASDVQTFESLARSDVLADLAQADALCRGELLAGLRVRSEPFEDWLRIERERLTALHMQVLEKLAQTQAHAGDADAATATAKRLVARDPLRERSTRLLMGLLATSGEGGRALVEHARAARTLRDELGLPPEAATLSLAEQIRRSRNAPIPGVARVPAAHEPTWSRGPSVAVLPFANLTGAAADQHVVEALTEDVTLALGRNKWLSVIAGAGDPDLRYRVSGTVRRDGERVRVVVRLVEGAAQRVLWSARVEHATASIFGLQDRLSAQIAARLSDAVQAAEINSVARKPTENATAYGLYLRASATCRKGLAGNELALRLLQQAIRLAPDFAVAYALAARCHHVQRMMGWAAPDDPSLTEGLRYANRALELDEADPEVLWMAGLAIANIDGDLQGGRPLIERSLDLNPNAVNALVASCFVLSQLGEGDAANECFLRAQELNPHDTSQHFQWHAGATAHFVERRYQEANDAADRALRQMPGYPPALRLKIATAALVGQIDDARAAARRLLDASPGESVASMRSYWKATLPYRDETLAATLRGWRAAGMPDE